MKLSFIIPCYEENPTRTIDSIKNQVYYDPRDVEIILCLDKAGRDIKYPNVITLPTEVNTGPGGARQKGLDIAKGEYITFVDADDIWYNLLGYALFLRDMYWNNGNEIDIMKFGILEQMRNGNYNLISPESIWCFGKIYRREFLKQNNIRFHDTLRVHEDSFFIRLAELCNPQIVNHGDIVYLWSDNPESTVRKNNGEYWQTEFDQYIKVLLLIRDERIKRCLPYDGAYDLAYCYTQISRMDYVYAEKCINLLKGAVGDWIECAVNKIQLGEYLEMAESKNQQRRIIPKITMNEFLEAIR